ncbi:MAG: hypothetical protein ABIO78_02230, partial [Thermoanaerobaculia bacterium]
MDERRLAGVDRRVDRRVDLGTAGVLIASSAVLHFVLLRSAGPFWRDEINSIRLAGSPTLHQFLRDLPFDSAPFLGFALLRGWLATVGGEALRWAGLLIGLGLLGMLCARRRFPLIALALIGTSGAIIRYGDSVRPYGLAMIAAVAAYLALERKSWGIGLLACAVAIHISFHNTVIVFAVCVAAAMARKSIVPLLIGAASALTLLIYVPTIRVAQQFSTLTRYEVDALWVWRKFEEAMAMSGPFALRIFLALFFIAVVFYASNAYAANTLLVLTISYAAFLLKLSYLMQPWYFVVYLAVAALSIDDLLTPVLRKASKFPIAAVVAIVIATAAYPAALAVTQQRSTNMDIVGAAAARDLVIVYPWYLGVSFSAYYKGTAPWQTMPPLPDHRLHRYDLARAASEDMRSGDELISRAASVLAGGGTVWVAGFPLYEESAAYVAKPERATGIAAADLRW